MIAEAHGRCCFRVLLILLTLALWLPGTAGRAQEPAGPAAWVLTVEGGIGPATADLLDRTLADAVEAGARLLILQMDTPGGLDTSMRAMIKRIIASPVPVVTYVAPQGARAASAGTYILYASHVAAMAPATNLGAATPVQLGAPSLPTPGGEEKSPAPGGDAMQHKILNDAIAYIRGLAELRGRNADWAEQAVREAASLDAEAALAAGVIDLVATDLPDLLRQLDGRAVKVQNRSLRLETADLVTVAVEPGWRYRFLLIITNPNVAYVLMLLGIYGLLLEFYNPGMGLPGIVGGISLLVALYALQLLPISYTGLALIALGIGLMIVEALTPSFGLFGLGGVVAFVIGSVMLMDTELPGYQIAMPLIAAFTLFSMLLALFALALALKARRRAVVSGIQTLVGQQARVLESFEGQGQVSIQGETWNARSARPLVRGERVTIIAIDGLVLEVEKGENP